MLLEGGKSKEERSKQCRRFDRYKRFGCDWHKNVLGLIGRLNALNFNEFDQKWRAITLPMCKKDWLPKLLK